MALFKIEFNVKLKHDLFLFVFSFQNRMRTLKSVRSILFAIISRDRYEHTHLRVPMFTFEQRY